MKRLTTLAALLAAATLAACSGGSDAPPPPPNETENVVIVDETPTENIAVVEPEASPTPTPTPTPVAETLPDEQQVQEDADAVGMTSRLPKPDGEPTPQPAE